MRSYRTYKIIDREEKQAAKEKKTSSFLGVNKDARSILCRSKRGRYDLKCVDKNSWAYWEYYCSDGYCGKWPTTGPAVLCLFMVWLLYRLLLDIIELSLSGISRLRGYFFSLAAKDKNKPGAWDPGH